MPSLTERGAISYDKRRQGIYTTLDTMFDVQLACLEEVDVNLAIHALRTGWSTRVFDTVPGLPDDVFKKLHEARDLKTLTLAHPTMMVEFIKAWCLRANETMRHTPEPGFCEVFVNIWPYRMSRAQARSFGDTLQKVLGDEIRVSMLNIDPLEISCLDAKRFFSAMIDNFYYRWLNERARTADLTSNKLLDVTLYAPRIIRGELANGDFAKLRDVDIFAQAEESMKPLIGLEFLEFEYFCTPVTADMLEDTPAPTPSTTPTPLHDDPSVIVDTGDV